MTTRRTRPGGSVAVAAAAQAAAEHAAIAAAQAAQAAGAGANANASAPPAPALPLPKAPLLTRRQQRAADQPTPEQAAALAARARAAAELPLLEGKELDAHVARAWRRWRALGAPKYHCAPMVDQSELPFRLLSRRHGCTAAYTPMLAARLFAGSGLYRAEHFTTCREDRPLFAQFCANDPAHFVAAAMLVRARCDYVDLNLGCPQRIAGRGGYGAFLMDDLGLVRRLVRAASECLLEEQQQEEGEGGEEDGGGSEEGGDGDDDNTPTTTALLSVKIRLFPPERGGVPATIAYAQMLEAAGASLIAVHGRTRAMKDSYTHRANWAAIAAVRAALRVPCLANGDVRSRRDADLLLEATECEGVMSAEPLLRDPGLFSEARLGRAWEDVPGAKGAAAAAAAADAEGAAGQEAKQEQQQQKKQEGDVAQDASMRGDNDGKDGETAADAATAADDHEAETARQRRVAALKAACDPGLLAHPLESLRHCREYLELCAQHPVPMRMMRGHVHKLLQDWLAEHTDLRARLTAGVGGLPGLLAVQGELEERVAASGRDYPVPKPSDRQVAREQERLRAREDAIAAQRAEEEAMAALVVREQEEGEEGGPGDGQEGAVEAARREMAAMACARGLGGEPAAAGKGRDAPAPAVAAVRVAAAST